MIDSLGRPLRDLRISLIDNCNFRCGYCMPREIFGSDYRFMRPDELLSFEEIAEVAAVFADLGVRKIKLTGGEPLLRPFVPRLVELLKKRVPAVEVDLITNGLLLAHLAPHLKDAGLDRVTVSLDSLKPERFAEMNGRGHQLAQVLEAIEVVRKIGFKNVKTNMVVIKGHNDDEVEDMALHFRNSGVTPRYIEFMDVGNRNGWSRDKVLPSAAILERLKAIAPVEAVEPAYRGETARRYAWKDGGGEFGFISSITEPFCGDCTRGRLSADGSFFTCLFATKGTDLKAALRGDVATSAASINPATHAASADSATGSAADRLRSVLENIWTRRGDRYSETRDSTLRAVKALQNTGIVPAADEPPGESAGNKIEMFYIGG